MSIAGVVTRGFGSFSDIAGIVTRGYQPAPPVPPPAPVSSAASAGGARSGPRSRPDPYVAPKPINATIDAFQAPQSSEGRGTVGHALRSRQRAQDTSARAAVSLGVAARSSGNQAARLNLGASVVARGRSRAEAGIAKGLAMPVATAIIKSGVEQERMPDYDADWTEFIP